MGSLLLSPSLRHVDPAAKHLDHRSALVEYYPCGLFDGWLRGAEAVGTKIFTVSVYLLANCFGHLHSRYLTAKHRLIRIIRNVDGNSRQCGALALALSPIARKYSRSYKRKYPLADYQTALALIDTLVMARIGINCSSASLRP